MINSDIHWEKLGRIHMNNEEIIRELLKDEKRSCLIIIDGRSGSGKTRLIKKVLAGFDNKVIIPYSEFIDLMVCDIKSRTDYFKESLVQYKIIAFDDMDFLRGKLAAQETTAYIINNLLKNNIHVIIIGINLVERVPKLLTSVNKEDITWITLH